MFHLENLPLQRELMKSAIESFSTEKDIVASFIVGSLASGKADRVSDLDIVFITKNDAHISSEHCFDAFERDKDIFYCLARRYSENVVFKKYIFTDLTSAEIHLIDRQESFEISKPYITVFDKEGEISRRLTDKPAPKHEDFIAYHFGDDGLIWEMLECIKWLSRGKKDLTKNYLKKLVFAMENERTLE